ncbi:MAG TPA: hypothetical protein VJ765_12335 [Chitinophagaceae bacterium]|nr:hypothetical protein [Chitinophagaceae bacterium]
MGKKLKTIPITMDDVSFIFNEHLDDFYFLTANCFCVQCKNKHQSTITNYKILLNQLYDIELEGSCLECGHRMGRYLETGENPKTSKNAEAIWKANKTLKELKIKKHK